MPVKKTAKAKKTAAKKTAAKKGPASKKTTSKGPAKKAAAKKTTAKKSAAKNVKKPASKKNKGGGFHREINPDTGFVVDTDSDTIAQYLLEGGESRAAIIEELESVLDTETRNGTDKQITNMVSGVLNKMIAAGFTVEQSFVVVPPTPASKRKAARKK